MKKNSVLTFAFFIVFAFAFQSVPAQATINIPKLPKIPKIKKDKPQPPQSENPPATSNSQSKETQSENNETSEKDDAEKPQDECQSDSIARLVADELSQMNEDLASYTPDRGWLYNGSPTYKYLLMAVSPSAKQAWQKKFNTISNCPKIVSGFEKLSVLASKKLPLFLPDKADYSYHNAAEENLMKTKINNLADHKIFYIGIEEPNWLIEKNDLDIPVSRYKHGMVWVRYVPNDHPYCRVYYINIIQDYAGGGTYGASFANFVDEALVGCPTGK